LCRYASSRASSRRGSWGGGGASGSGAGAARSKTVNQTIAERVLERVGTGVGTVAERISEVQGEGDDSGDNDEGGYDDEGDESDDGGGTTPLNKFRRAARTVQATVKMDFGTDLMRRIPPPPELGTVHSYIAIDRSKSTLYPTYKFYTQAEDSTQDRFILAARQEPMSLNNPTKHKRYIFSTDPDNCSVSAAGYWGKLTSNFMVGGLYKLNPGDP
jgi:hypothetical protein